MNEQDERLRSTDYWDSNDDYPIHEWHNDVINGDTLLGYHDWIVLKKEGE